MKRNMTQIRQMSFNRLKFNKQPRVQVKQEDLANQISPRYRNRKMTQKLWQDLNTKKNFDNKLSNKNNEKRCCKNNKKLTKSQKNSV